MKPKSRRNNKKTIRRSKTMKRSKTIKRMKKRGGSSYNMPLSYFGKPRQSSFISEANASTKCAMPDNHSWNCFKPTQKMFKI